MRFLLRTRREDCARRRRKRTAAAAVVVAAAVVAIVAGGISCRLTRGGLWCLRRCGCCSKGEEEGEEEEEEEGQIQGRTVAFPNGLKMRTRRTRRTRRRKITVRGRRRTSTAVMAWLFGPGRRMSRWHRGREGLPRPLPLRPVWALPGMGVGGGGAGRAVVAA